MTIKTYYRRILIMLLIASVIYTIDATYRFINRNIPDTINLRADEDETFDLKIPVAATISSDDREVSLEGETGLLNKNIKISKENIRFFLSTF